MSVNSIEIKSTTMLKMETFYYGEHPFFVLLVFVYEIFLVVIQINELVCRFY